MTSRATITTTKTTTAFCDSCTNAAQDEAGIDLGDDGLFMVLAEMGMDIADHPCDTEETGELCSCACQGDRVL